MSTESLAAEPQLNATPLIDVLLVLLVMLIFTLPVMTHATKLNLPAGSSGTRHPQVFHLRIEFDGVMRLNDEQFTSVAALERRLRILDAVEPAPVVHFSADSRVSYEPVAQALAATQRARVRNLSIVNLPRL